MNKRILLILFVALFFGSAWKFFEVNPFRIYPYLQVYDQSKVQITWFSNSFTNSSIKIVDGAGTTLLNQTLEGKSMPELYYTNVEKNQVLEGLEQGSWIGSDESFKYQVQIALPPNKDISYTVELGGQTFTAQFKSPPTAENWDKIRFFALADSETDPRGRVTNRAWYPGTPLFRPITTVPELWKQKFGSTVEQGIELPNYMLTEEVGYAENLKIINDRNPNFMVMPGDLVQGAGYQPGWDEFFRQNAGEKGKGLSKYAIIPALGNWESFGAINGGYATNERGAFLPVLSRSRFHAYFETPVVDPLQNHRQSYFRADYGPITILTLDSSNGTPDQSPSDFDGQTKLKGKEYTVAGTDTQENYTEAQYKGAGGKDLSSFGPGSDQYNWLESNLKDAREAGQLIFVQYHHIAFSSGEHGVPLNHELSIGQVGTPLRVLNPLLEEYGVIAVFSGHDEIFERSFVDEDKDGKGIMYYDVGVAGDGMRGEKRDWVGNPLNTLDYNPYRKWTADQSEPEIWKTSGANPVLEDGGKHYGHLEINLEKISEGEEQFALINFTPVYAFPVMDQNYNLVKVERRVYKDEVQIKVPLRTTLENPILKENIKLYLDEEGKVQVEVTDLLESYGSYLPGEFTLSKNEFSCSDIPEATIEITAKKETGSQEWSDIIKISVLDTISPTFSYGNANLAFDLVIGSVSLDGPDFAISDPWDNCSFGLALEFDKNKITCEDIDEESGFIKMPVQITIKDVSNNATVVNSFANLNIIESKKVSIENTIALFPNQNAEIKLGDELGYEVLEWQRIGVEIPGETGKTIEVSEEGLYRAKLRLESGCVAYSQLIEVRLQELPYPSLKEKVELSLNENGIAELSREQVFLSSISPDLIVTFSKSVFNCDDLGVASILVSIKDGGGNEWEESILVEVVDTTSPILITKNLEVKLDATIGTLALKAEDFVVSLSDNCEIKELSINKNELTCEDLGKEIQVELTVVDFSGNLSVETAFVYAEKIESKKISILGESAGTIGSEIKLELGSEFSFQVLGWYRGEDLISSSDAKVLTVTESGVYKAQILPTNGCVVFSSLKEVTFSEGSDPKPYPPLNEKVELILNEDGMAELSKDKVFQGSISPDLIVTFSQSVFNCEDLGEKSVLVTIKNSEGKEWEESVNVIVQDTSAPILETKNLELELDLTIGSLALKAEDFVASLSDNCAVKELTININSVSCESVGKEIQVELRAVDNSGNVTEKTATVLVRALVINPVIINGPEGICLGENNEITLTSDASFEVVRWRRNGNEIQGQNGKTLTIEEGGVYHAVIRYEGGCLFETEKIEIKTFEKPSGEIIQDGNILRAPDGYQYQWFRNGTLLPGETKRTIALNQMGLYTVELTNEAGCKAILPAVEVTISGILGAEILSQELKIYPNPVQSEVIVEATGDLEFAENSWQVYDMNGKNLNGDIKVLSQSPVRIAFEVSSLANGTYLISVKSTKSEIFLGRIIKVK